MKSYHIKAYTHQAEIKCADCVAKWAKEELKKEEYSLEDIELCVRSNSPGFDVGVFAYRSEALLQELADIWNIDLENEYSFDSDDFPKLIFVDQIEFPEYCGVCGGQIK